MLWIDVARGFGIILVVLGHTIDGLVDASDTASFALRPVRDYFYVTFDVIYSFHMPLFFFLSGLVFLASIEKRPLPESLWRRVVTILWPYLLWSYLFFGLKFATPSMVNNPISLGDLIFAPWPPKEHLWFLASLFAIQVLALPLKYAGRYKLHIVAAVGLVCVVLSCLMAYPGPVEFIWRTNLSAPAFLAGILYAGFRIGVPRGTVVLLSLALFVAAQFAYVPATGSLQRWLFPFVSLIGVFASINLLRWFVVAWPRNWLNVALAYLGIASMAIYPMHVVFTAATRVQLEQLGIDSVRLQVLFGTIVGIAGPLLVYLVMKRLRLTRFFGVGGSGAHPPVVQPQPLVAP
jgi:fucose 4-O-acetylase-like acetyltransferase